ncbi:hypothetical protein LCY76_23760 [Fictibacillus sp. KIGAM418]|uniref:Uncharacterized protein n=1 Tax=Fictibacillus marinisediminis TaxID=2878389 RepID=A0A9X2BHS8_9BACL|nr:hypothetical protein [Fictibacillus marinisediminis]MCK6259587.1 hypothetical protein [Fictibacillus marinisediminis]
MELAQIDLFEVMEETVEVEDTTDQVVSRVEIGDEVKVILHSTDTTEDRCYKEDFLKGKGKVVKKEKTSQGRTVCYVLFNGRNREAVVYDTDLLILY